LRLVKLALGIDDIRSERIDRLSASAVFQQILLVTDLFFPVVHETLMIVCGRARHRIDLPHVFAVDDGLFSGDR